MNNKRCQYSLILKAYRWHVESALQVCSALVGLWIYNQFLQATRILAVSRSLFCQQLFSPRSVGCLPLVVQSAIFHLLSIHFRSSNFIEVWISSIRSAINVLNPYGSFWIIALTESESTIKCSLLNVCLVSSFMKFDNLFDKTPAFNSGQTTGHFLMCAALPLAAISLLSNLPFGNSHVTYAHVPKACSDASLNMMRLRSWLTSGGWMHRLNEILSILNNALKKHIQSSFNFDGISLYQSKPFPSTFRSCLINSLAFIVNGVARPKGS